MRRAVFLDRDGVINSMWLDPEHGLVDSPANPDQFSLLPGVATGIRLIREMGFLSIVVSNQPGIAKGKMTPSLLQAVTSRMEEELARQEAGLDGIYYCLHHPDALLPEYRAACSCRKPEPGLLLKAAAERSIDLSRSYMVGDGVTDIQAGSRAGCKTAWIGSWKCDICELTRRHGSSPDMAAPDLRTAVQRIQAEERASGNLY